MDGYRFEFLSSFASEFRMAFPTNGPHLPAFFMNYIHRQLQDCAEYLTAVAD
jgi:hypothetical protein